MEAYLKKIKLNIMVDAYKTEATCAILQFFRRHKNIFFIHIIYIRQFLKMLKYYDIG